MDMTTTHSLFAQHLLSAAQTDLNAVRCCIANNPSGFDASAQALQWSASENKPEFVAELLRVSDATANENQALNSAVAKGHMECVKILFPHSDFNFYNQAVSKATHSRRVEVLEWILQNHQASVRTIVSAFLYVTPLSLNGREIFNVLYQHGGRWALEEFLDIKQTLINSRDHCYFLKFEHWANEEDRKRIAAAVDTDPCLRTIKKL